MGLPTFHRPPADEKKAQFENRKAYLTYQYHENLYCYPE